MGWPQPPLASQTQQLDAWQASTASCGQPGLSPSAGKVAAAFTRMCTGEMAAEHQRRRHSTPAAMGLEGGGLAQGNSLLASSALELGFVGQPCTTRVVQPWTALPPWLVPPRKEEVPSLAQ